MLIEHTSSAYILLCNRFFLITLQANCDRKENHWSRDFVWNVLFVAVLEGCRMVSL